MSQTPAIIVTGLGAVSPAGWGASSLHQALTQAQPLPVSELGRPGWPSGLRVRKVPPPNPRPSFLAHPRLRRSSPVSHFAAAAAIEALGGLNKYEGQLRLGIVFCTEAGTLNYSRRFFEEARRDPATASPLIFPETVINAPAGHLAALLDSTGPAYTLMGDASVFLQGLALAAQWLMDERIDVCLVIGAEELDWLPADVFRMFHHDNIMSEGAGALCLRRGADHSEPILASVSDAFSYGLTGGCPQALRGLRAQLRWADAPDALLCDSRQAMPGRDAAEERAWADWPGMRCSPKGCFGEGMAASAAWQCVAALLLAQRANQRRAVVSVAGCNQQALGAVFDLPEINPPALADGNAN